MRTLTYWEKALKNGGILTRTEKKSSYATCSRIWTLWNLLDCEFFVRI